MSFGKGTVTATDVKVGDCLTEIPDDTRVLTVQDHRVRPNRTPARSSRCCRCRKATSPGSPRSTTYADKCSPELASYAPDAMTDDSVQLYVLYPTAETWEQGDRAVTCIATLDPPRTGSLKG